MKDSPSRLCATISCMEGLYARLYDPARSRSPEVEIPDDDEVASLLEGGSHEQFWPSSPTEIATLALTFSWVGRLRAFCARALFPHAT